MANRDLASSSFRIYYEDVDVGGLLYHSKYLNFCERARSDLFFKKNHSPIEGAFHFVVKSLQAEYIKPARFGDEVVVESYLVEMKRASLELLQEVKSSEDSKLFRMHISLVCLEGEKIAKIPNHIRRLFEVDSSSY